MAPLRMPLRMPSRVSLLRRFLVAPLVQLESLRPALDPLDLILTLHFAQDLC